MEELIEKEKIAAVITEYGMFIGKFKVIDEYSHVVLDDAISVQGDKGVKVGSVIIRDPKIIMKLDTTSPFFKAYFEVNSGITLGGK